MDLRGKLAVVTGASRGFGAATGRLLARRGARVVLVARGAAALHALAEEIGSAALALPVDLTDAAAVERVFASAQQSHGNADILVNCAGTGAFRFVEETSPDEAYAMVGAPYLAAFNATRALLPSMVARNSGHIVNVTSAVALRPIPGATAYAAGCWALRGFTEALRADLHRMAIGVTLLVAGTSTTPGYDHYPGVVERTPAIARLAPLVTPEIVAEAIAIAIERNRRRCVVPRTLAAMVALDRIAPWLVEALVLRTGWTRARHVD